MILHFNKGKPLNDHLKIQIEQYFSYKWANDHNQGLDDDWELQILDELPVEVQDKLYFGFLFTDFLEKFSTFFLIENVGHY